MIVLSLLGLISSAWAQSNGAGLVEFPEPRRLRAPNGFVVLNEAGQVLKREREPGNLEIRAYRDRAGGRQFMTEWSYQRQKDGAAPNWIVAEGAELDGGGKSPGVSQASPAVALNPSGEGRWWKAIDGRTLVWNNYPRPNDFVRWDGPADDQDRAHGAGLVSWFKGLKPVTRYEGVMVHGRMDGMITATDPDGGTGVGYYLEGVKSGPWEYQTQAGRSVVSFWKGERVQMDHLAGQANGVWLRSQSQGAWILQWPSASIRSADWTGGMTQGRLAHGFGELTQLLPDGSRKTQAGQMVNGRFTPSGPLPSERERPVRAVKASKSAWVIGVAEFDHAPRLMNPVRDARLMSETLKELGFEVETLLDPRRQDIMAGLARLRSRTADHAEAAVVYFAGHGIEHQGENYLIARDSRPGEDLELAAETVPVRAIMATLEELPVQNKVLILDACRDNPFPAGTVGGPSRGLARVQPAAGTLIAYAADAGQAASDGAGKNGLYTGVLARFLKLPGLRIEDVFARTRREVFEISQGRQLPAEYSKLVHAWYPSGRPAGEGSVDLVSIKIGAETFGWSDLSLQREAILRDLELVPNLEQRYGLINLGYTDPEGRWRARAGTYPFKSEMMRSLPFLLGPWLIAYPSSEFLSQADKYFRYRTQQNRDGLDYEIDPLVLDICVRNSTQTDVLIEGAALSILQHENSSAPFGEANELAPDKHVDPKVHFKFDWPLSQSQVDHASITQRLEAIDTATFKAPLVMRPGTVEILRATIPFPLSGGTYRALIKVVLKTTAKDVSSGQICLECYYRSDENEWPGFRGEERGR